MALLRHWRFLESCAKEYIDVYRDRLKGLWLIRKILSCLTSSFRQRFDSDLTLVGPKQSLRQTKKHLCASYPVALHDVLRRKQKFSHTLLTWEWEIDLNLIGDYKVGGLKVEAENRAMHWEHPHSCPYSLHPQPRNERYDMSVHTAAVRVIGGTMEMGDAGTVSHEIWNCPLLFPMHERVWSPTTKLIKSPSTVCVPSSNFLSGVYNWTSKNWPYIRWSFNWYALCVHVLVFKRITRSCTDSVCIIIRLNGIIRSHRGSITSAFAS